MLRPGRDVQAIDRRSIVKTLPLIVAGLACGSKEAPKSGSARAGVSESDALGVDKVVAGQTLYVPAYSHVYTADGAQPLDIAATLFVRNVDRGRSIVLTGVRYVDSGGRTVREFLARPLKIGPLASVDFFIPESDETGGPSPCFLVEWASETPAVDPVVESVMIGTAGTQGISFVGHSRVLETRRPPSRALKP